MFINASALAGANLIVGNPVASLSLLVNGVSKKSILTPFLSFSPSITDTLTANILLKAGDKVTAQLYVLVQDPVAGLIDYVGTVMLAGGSTPATVDPSTFNITLLSTLCTVPAGSQGAACIPCAPMTIPCSPVNIKCKPVDSLDCNPCQ